MLDLSISVLNFDFTVCAKLVLNIHQGLNEFRIRHSARMIAEPVPIFRAPLRIRDLTEDDWLNGLWPSAAMLAPEFPGVSRAPIELSPLQDRAQVISYSEYCHTAAARRSSWTRRRML